MTDDECHERAREAKRLAAETQDLWEREMLFKIADQWRLLEAHSTSKKLRSAPKFIVVAGKSITG
jgi:hypothetical protein